MWHYTRIRLLAGMVMLLLLAGCGGGGGGGGVPANNWDQMVWDQDNWA